MAKHTWTEDNTEGFTQEDIDVLNEAQQHLELAHPKVDPTNIADMLNNAWTPEADARQLQRTVERRLTDRTALDRAASI